MKYWAYINDEVSQQPYNEEELKQLQGFGPDLLICSETSAVSADPDWRTVKDLLPHLIRPKAPNFAKFRPKPPMPAAPSQPVQQPQQEMPAMQQDVLPIPSILPAGINAMPFGQSNQGNMQFQNQPQQAPVQNDFNRELLAQLESLNTKINSLENKIVEQEKELEEAYNRAEDYYNPPTLISEPQNEQEDDVLEIPFENDFVPFDAGKSSEEIAKEAEEILSNPTSAEIEEYNTDDQKTELMTFGSDIQNILEDTIRKDIKEQEEKKEKKTEEKDDKPIIAEDLISRTTLSFPTNDEKEEDENEEDIIEETVSDELNIDDLDELLEQQNKTSEEEKVEETKEEEKPAEEPAVEEKAEEAKEEVKEEEQPEENKEEIAEETPAEEPVVEEENKETEEQPKENKEETPAEEPAVEEETAKTEEVSEEEPEKVPSEDIQEETKPQEETVEAETAAEETSEEEQPAEEQSAEEKPAEEPAVEEENKEAVEEDQHILSLNDAEELKVTEEPAVETEEKPEEVPSEDVQEETETPEETSEETETETVEEKTEEEPMTMGVSISKDETTAAVLDEIAQEKSQYTEPEPTPEKLFEELENTAQEQAAEEDNLNVDQIIEETQNQPMPTVNENAAGEEEKTEEEKPAEEQSAEEPAENAEKVENAENKEELGEDLPKEDDEFLKTFTTSVEEVFLDQPTAIISDYVPPSDDTQRETSQNADVTSTTMMETIRREKPSDIKTVPLVSGAMGQEIWSSPYVESATAELRKKSKIADILKFALLVIVVILFLVIALSGFALLGVVPEKFSPLHRITYFLQKSPEETKVVDEDMEPEIIMDNNIAAAPVENETVPQENANSQEDNLIFRIQGYSFPDGTTLERRILAAHPNLTGDIEWSIYPTEEQNVYTVAVKLPPNNEGQSFSYRFNYNTNEGLLTPTTSESQSIMQK